MRLDKPRQSHLTGRASSLVQPVYRKLLHQVFALTDSSTSVLEREWDLLVVLDACRYDLMYEVAPAYDFLTDVGSAQSVDTATRHWMLKTFSDEYAADLAETVYVCGNPFSDRALDPERFQVLDEVWRYAWDHDVGTVHPRPLTDRAIALAREHQPSRLIVHYMQPHCPFVGAPDLMAPKRLDAFGKQPSPDVWKRLQAGEVTREAVWVGYRMNLEYVLNDVALLLQNVDADRVVITSDHGNAIGEWGLYGHPIHMPLSCLRDVPWIETTAEDSGAYEPDTHAEGDESELDVTARLNALGYLDE